MIVYFTKQKQTKDAAFEQYKKLRISKNYKRYQELNEIYLTHKYSYLGYIYYPSDKDKFMKEYQCLHGDFKEYPVINRFALFMDIYRAVMLPQFIFSLVDKPDQQLSSLYSIQCVIIIALLFFRPQKTKIELAIALTAEIFVIIIISQLTYLQEYDKEQIFDNYSQRMSRGYNLVYMYIIFAFFTVAVSVSSIIRGYKNMLPEKKTTFISPMMLAKRQLAEQQKALKKEDDDEEEEEQSSEEDFDMNDDGEKIEYRPEEFEDLTNEEKKQKLDKLIKQKVLKFHEVYPYLENEKVEDENEDEEIIKVVEHNAQILAEKQKELGYFVNNLFDFNISNMISGNTQKIEIKEDDDKKNNQMTEESLNLEDQKNKKSNDENENLLNQNKKSKTDSNPLKRFKERQKLQEEKKLQQIKEDKHQKKLQKVKKKQNMQQQNDDENIQSDE